MHRHRAMGKTRTRTAASSKKFCVGILLYCIISVSCGIQSFPYLAPVESGDITSPAPSEKRFIFKNNTENNPEYLQGYEIYYKFYSTDPFETVPALDYEEHTDLINKQIEIDGVTVEEIQTAYGYYRLYANNTDFPIPLLPLTAAQKDDPIEFVLDFNTIVTSIFPKAEYQTSDGIVVDTIELARYVEKEEQITAGPTLYNFTPDELTSDYSDFSKDLEPNENDQVFLSLYVATYGKSSPFEDFYSYVQHLGAVKLKTTTLPGD
jgi:hypothetical protein